MLKSGAPPEVNPHIGNKFKNLLSKTGISKHSIQNHRGVEKMASIANATPPLSVDTVRRSKTVSHGVTRANSLKTDPTSSNEFVRSFTAIPKSPASVGTSDMTFTASKNEIRGNVVKGHLIMTPEVANQHQKLPELYSNGSLPSTQTIEIRENSEQDQRAMNNTLSLPRTLGTPTNGDDKLLRRRNTLSTVATTLKPAQSLNTHSQDWKLKSVLSLHGATSRSSINPGQMETVIASVGNSRRNFVVTHISHNMLDGSGSNMSIPVIAGSLEDAMMSGQVSNDEVWVPMSGDDMALPSMDGFGVTVEKRRFKGFKEVLGAILGMDLTTKRRPSKYYPVKK
ncbi:hypothetical protein HDU77_000697 [Chytriomyces hyalinus]|nr:hypothetical protein HDU77_000697 [Chytriomyces hyalinus]